MVSCRNFVTCKINPCEIEFAELCNLSFMGIAAEGLQD